MDKNTCCRICVKEFFKVSNLTRHIKKFHPETFEPLPKKQFAFTCQVCGKNFSYIRNYRFHMKTHNPNPPQTKIMKNCPLCTFVSEKTELHEHFTRDHEIRLIKKKLTFEDTETFMKWKMSLENNTQSHFVKRYTQQTKYYGEVSLFVCHRSGHYSPKTNDKGKNDIATKKIGGFCPANIKMMKKNDGFILVSYLQNHIGHSNKEVNRNGVTKKKMNSILLRHKNSCNLDKKSLVKSENVWHFHSKNKDEIFVISVTESQCELECPFTCKDCKVCIHRYRCSCKDWRVKSNMCVHIHLLCSLLNENEVEKPEQMLTGRSGSSLDITDLIVYDGAGGAEGSIVKESKNPIIIHKLKHIVPEIPIEEKNIILQEFSDILIKCNSINLFQEIVTIVGGLKARLDCDEILSPTQNFISQ